jgi:hypothetical protein
MTMLSPMTRRSTLRFLANLALCGLVALFATGLPLSYDADHQCDSAHIEHDHGGHGTVLLEYDEQLLSKTLSFTAVDGPQTMPWTEAVANGEHPRHRRSFTHNGRDPPRDSRPRAPPIS